MLCVKCFFSTYSEVPFAATLFLEQFSSSLAVGALFLNSVFVFLNANIQPYAVGYVYRGNGCHPVPFAEKIN